MPPVSLIGHNHVCPDTTHKIPHVGGPALTGDSTCTVNGIPVALIGDKCSCAVGGPASITSGSSLLTVNGTPVAMVGSSTSHGGSMVQGDPALVVAG